MAFIESKDKIVAITCTFMFSRKDNIWDNVFEFEHDLATLFKHKGLQAEVIQMINGSTGTRMFWIRDISKDLQLRNDRDIYKPGEMPKAKPEKSYKLVKKLTANITQGFNPKGKK